jgi:hypothetical protein
MSKNIKTAVAYLNQQAIEVEAKIEALNPDTSRGCVNCGYLTQENVDADQEIRALIVSLTEISEALDYLESLL